MWPAKVYFCSKPHCSIPDRCSPVTSAPLSLHVTLESYCQMSLWGTWIATSSKITPGWGAGSSITDTRLLSGDTSTYKMCAWCNAQHMQPAHGRDLAGLLAIWPSLRLLLFSDWGSTQQSLTHSTTCVKMTYLRRPLLPFPLSSGKAFQLFKHLFPVSQYAGPLFLAMGFLEFSTHLPPEGKGLELPPSISTQHFLPVYGKCLLLLICVYVCLAEPFCGPVICCFFCS